MIKKIIIMAVVAFALMSCDTGMGTSLNDEYDAYVVSVTIIPVTHSYASSIDLDYTVGYSDGSNKIFSKTFSTTIDALGDKECTVTVDGISDTITVDFEDWRLVGTWTNSGGNISYTFNQDGSYNKNITQTGNWATDNNKITADIDGAVGMEFEEDDYGFDTDGNLWFIADGNDYIKQ